MRNTNNLNADNAGDRPCKQPVILSRPGVQWLGRLFLMLLVSGCAAGTTPQTPGASSIPVPETSAALDFPATGPARAAVTLSVYEDYQWGHCARLEPILQQVLDEYRGTVKLVIIPFPPINNQPSLLAASAALAAHAQGQFWAFREALFLHNGPVTTTDLHDIGEQVGLDLPRFFNDLTSRPIQHLLTDGINDGTRRGVQGTPTIFVNQSELMSNHIDGLRKAIQQAAAQ